MSWWGGAWLAGRTSADDVLDHASRHEWGQPAEVLEVLGQLRRSGARGLRLVLPVPGDPLGLAGPAAFNLAALDAGQSCIAEAGGLGLVATRVDDATRWTVQPAIAGVPDDLREADRALRQELLRASDHLADLGLVHSSPALGNALVDLRRPIRFDLPQGTPSEAVGLAGRALRLLRVIQLAQAASSEGITTHDAGQMEASFRSLGRSARRALMAACSPVTWPPALTSGP